MEDDRRRDVLKRLSYIEGHVSGIRKMVEEDKYCVDILRQTYAVRKALEKLEAIIKEQTLWKRQPLSPPTYLVSIASTPSRGLKENWKE